MGPPSYMRSVVDRNVVMRRIPVLQCFCMTSCVVKVRIIEFSWKSLPKCTENYDLHNCLSGLLDTSPHPQLYGKVGNFSA